ncbi:glycosyl hydrolase catalytic core-domain-containing protein [Xylariales sp. AK1849]|nr:glycosyl hydrolase catalytic core-domain-containing protein [Xylariales sp. AK1849]
MFTKYIVPALCATNLLSGVEAARGHRHLHKKDVVYDATVLDIETVYETVTVYANEEPATSTSSLSTVSMFAASHPASTTSTLAAAPTTAVVEPAAPSPTTLATAVKSATEEAAASAPVVAEVATKAAETTTAAPVVPITTAVAAAATTTAAAAATSSAAASSTGSSGDKRGLAYTDASLVSSILSMASGKFSWAYNWGADDGGLTSSIPFIPMLWGPTHYNADWVSKAEAAVTAGTDALLSFNECDNAGQCNMGAADAASYHKQYMNIYAGKTRIGAPSISSSQEANQGLDWLEQFFTACDGACSYDFCNIHWYGPGGVDGANEFLGYLVGAQATCGKNLWVTEWAAISGDEDAFMSHALDQLDNNATFSFVEKYSYFYLATGSLFDSSTTLSGLGQIYATQ